MAEAPSPYVAAQTNPRAVFFLQGKTKRPVPNDATLRFILQQPGVTVRAVPDATLAQLAVGAPLPARNDGIVYRGPDGAIEQMRGGLRLRVPDATTLRALGLSTTPVLTISAADRATIPAGAAVPSASWFAQPPRANVPIVMLPLRIETRFGHATDGKPELWIRVFPDDVHINSFEPELTAAESTARAAYLADPGATGTDPDRRLAAWASIARRFGSLRAAWIVSAGAGTSGARTAEWTRAPTTALLPDRFIFCAYDFRGGVVRQPGAELADGLVVGPSPTGGDPATDEGLRWIRDFPRAVEMGLGARLPISAAQAATGFSRVLVFGVKSRLDPMSAATRLGDAFDAHHFTGGIELLPHGTPTNNADGTKSGYAGDDPGFARSFAVERGRARTPSSGQRGDGDRLANGLGITPARFAFVRGAEGRHGDAPAAMNTLLWPATLGYYLGHLATGAVPDAADVIPAARAHFIAWVRARGPWPTLRIGRQPYGVVPVVWSGAYQSLEGGPLTSRLLALLQTLRPFWSASAGRVERVGRGNDADATLASILALSPSSTSYAGRTVLGPQFNQYYWQFVGQLADSTWWTQLHQLATAQLGTAAQTMASTRVGNATYLGKHFPLSPKLVAAPLTGAALTDNYLAAFAAMTLAQLREAAPAAQPAPLLWLLARHAALRQYADSAYDLLGEAVSPVARLEQEVFDISPSVHTPRVWEHLELKIPDGTPDGTPVGAFLDKHKLDGPAPFAEFWRAMGTLRSLSTTDLDRVLRETLDLGSNRLDAWYTSLASLRLDWLRKQPNNQRTLYLGAYGWVEDVRPQPSQTSWGYVHAPSLGHAATAAVLRSGYLTHLGGGSNTAALAVDLSSARVRKAQHLLDGVRAGQPLGAQLGYQFERALHERQLDSFIARFRTFAPVDGVAGDHVLDGLVLLERRADIPWGAADPPGFPAAGDPTQEELDAELSVLADTLDAVSDLMLAESVYQLVGGSPLRAGATVDALGRGESPPPVLDVTRTPRRGGVITHRLLALLSEGPAAGWSSTPRGQAEPRLNAFVARLLGPPARVRARAQIVSPSGSVVRTIGLTLADLGLGPLDIVALRERAPGAAGQSEIEQRLARVAWSRRPATTPAGSSVVLVLERDPALPPALLALDELLTAAGSARALVMGARGATLADFSSPDHPADLAIDTTELQARADQATTALRLTRASLDGGTAVDVALDGASLFGAEGAVPALDSGLWPAQADRVRAELDARLAQLAALELGFARAGASPVVLRDHDLARLGIVFGPNFPVVARLTAVAAGTLPALFGATTTLLRKRPVDAITWLSRVARVRRGAARLDEAMLHAESLSSGARVALSVAQLPATPNDVWAGLPLPDGAKPADRISIVALNAPAAATAALFVDEWLETIPNASETTGVTFHVDDARSRAPQAILLAVQPDAFPEWTLESVEGTVLEALELAHLRAVDPDALAGVGHFLPALFFATNLGPPPADAITTDLTLAAPLPRPTATSTPILDGLFEVH